MRFYRQKKARLTHRAFSRTTLYCAWVSVAAGLAAGFFTGAAFFTGAFLAGALAAGFLAVGLAVTFFTRSTFTGAGAGGSTGAGAGVRLEEHPSELQSLMRLSFAGFCFKKKT